MNSKVPDRESPSPADSGLVTLKRRSLSTVVADALAKAIRDGELVPGDRILEVPMSERLGVSRATLREAIKTLAADGLLEIREDRGAHVRRLDVDEIADMIVMRATIEGMAARLLAGNRDPDALAKIARVARQMEKESRKGKSARWRELDTIFHETIVTASGNPMLLKAWSNINMLLRLFMQRINPAYDTSPQRVVSNHDRFVQVLTTGSPGEAERVVRSIIVSTGFKALGRPAPAGLGQLDEEFTGEGSR
jgi:DNA-binding GntR family transcriptional regulator